MKGLSLADMKKIKEDGKSATFKHKDGHEIRVAISSLSPELKKQLSKLPIHAAEGADMEEDMPSPHALPPPREPSIPMDAANVALQSAGLAPEQGTSPLAPQGAGLAPEQSAPKQAPSQKPMAQQKQGADVTPPPAPENSYSPSNQPQMPAPVSVKQELTQEQAAWENDLKNGHITPKTYSDLYAKKDTLGKLGTIFGLLVGGAGAGLSHQPNALLEMMNKEIERDLDAQKNSKTNAHNFLRITQQDEMNQAQKKLMSQQGSLTEQQSKSVGVETDLKSFALAQSRMLQSSYHNLVDQVNRMPDGPQKELAKQNLGVVYMKMGEKINNINDQVQGAAAALNMINQPSGGSEQQFQRQNQMLELGGHGELSRSRQEHHIPGATGSTSTSVSGEDRNRIEAMDVLDNKVKDVLDFAKKHHNVKDLANPQINRVAKQKAHELMTFYNSSLDKLGMTEGRMEFLKKQIDENPNNPIGQIFGSLKALEEIKDSNLGRKEILLKNKYGTSAEKSTGKSSDKPLERKAKDGTVWLYDAKTLQPIGKK